MASTPVHPGASPGPHLPRPNVLCGPHARGVGPHTAGAVPTPGPHYEARGVPQGVPRVGVPGASGSLT